MMRLTQEEAGRAAWQDASAGAHAAAVPSHAADTAGAARGGL